MAEDPESAWTSDFCLRPYHPYRFGGARNPKFTRADGRLLDLKDDKPGGVESAARDFGEGLNQLGLPHGTIIIAVPGHEAKESNVGTALARVAELIANNDNRYVANVDLLIRTLTVPKKAQGGTRDIQTQIASMTVAGGTDLRKATVVVLDDTVTTGASLAAARYLLNKAGAQRVAAVGLARTVKYL